MQRNQSGHNDPRFVERDFTPQHLGLFEARGIPPEMAKAAGFKSITKHEAPLWGLPGADGLLIPYPSPDDFGRLRLDVWVDKIGALHLINIR
jgi:hypothetical protein